MSDYLSNLISRSYGQQRDLRPRPRSIFEPQPRAIAPVVEKDFRSELQTEEVSGFHAENEPDSDENPSEDRQSAGLQNPEDRAIPKTAATEIDLPIAQDFNSNPKSDMSHLLDSGIDQDKRFYPENNLVKKEHIWSDKSEQSRPDLGSPAVKSEQNPASPHVHRSAEFAPGSTVKDSDRGIMHPERYTREKLPMSDIFSKTRRDPAKSGVAEDGSADDGAAEGSAMAETVLQTASEYVDSEIEARYSIDRVLNIAPIKKSSSSFSPELRSKSEIIIREIESESDINVTIGRVEIRAIMAPAPVPNRKAKSRRGLSLDDYLKQPNGGKR